MVKGLEVKVKQEGDGVACHHLGDGLFWKSRYPSPFEHDGSLYSGLLPGSEKQE